MALDTLPLEVAEVEVEGAPAIPGLRFRHYRGVQDIPLMAAVRQASMDADGIKEVTDVNDMVRMYSNLRNSDPVMDTVIVEVNGKMIGYKRVEWREELDGTRVYDHFGNVDPEWRGKGIGAALIRHSEKRLREIAASQPDTGERYFETWLRDSMTGMRNLLETNGYTPVRHFYEMVRPNLENIPDIPMPEGIEVRPVQPEHLRAIWEAEVEAFKDHWSESTVEEADFERWQQWRNFKPEMWMVAWDGDQVVGMVRNFIDPEENARYDRKRGYTENISVRRPWRKRGVAKALIARSFALLKSLGMEEAALGVDTQNPSGALQLYESMGFAVDHSGSAYRKKMD